MIERYILSRLHYWTGRMGAFAWSPKHEDAIRFARQQDGERMFVGLCDCQGNVVEHSWAS